MRLWRAPDPRNRNGLRRGMTSLLGAPKVLLPMGCKALQGRRHTAGKIVGLCMGIAPLQW